MNISNRDHEWRMYIVYGKTITRVNVQLLIMPLATIQLEKEFKSKKEAIEYISNMEEGKNE